MLGDRHAWLAREGGIAPESVLALTPLGGRGRRAARAGRGRGSTGGFAELHVHTVHGFCARLLRDEAEEAGIDPFVVTVSPADRLAMLLERVDELTLRLHDFRGNPATMLAGVLRASTGSRRPA